MKLKKIFVFVLALTLIFTGVLVPVSASADANEGVPTATVRPTVGYSQEAAEAARVDLSAIPSIKDVNLPTADAYRIDSEEAFAQFVALVNGGNDFKDQTVYLAGDLDLSGVKDQSPIGIRKGYEEVTNTFVDLQKAQFMGTFDGQGYAITGILIEKTIADTCYSGFFGWTSGATVKNVKLEGSVSHLMGDYAYKNTNFVGTGGLIACADGANVVDNVYCDIDVVGLRQTGGIIGRHGATVSNTTNAGDVNGANCAGGFGGFVSDMTVISSLNTGKISSSFSASGFLARARGNCTVNGCVNDGVIVNTDSGTAAGFVGQVEAKGTANLVSCINYGVIVSQNGKTDAFGHKLDECTLNIDETCADRTRAGYHPELIEKVALEDIADILSVSEYTAKEYQITSPQGLVKLSELVKGGNSFTQTTFYLANDIDMTGIDLEPIGFIFDSEKVKERKPFSGIFDGQGHTVSNLVMSQDTNIRSGLGLFGFAQNATIQNLVLDSTCSFTLKHVDAYNGMAAVLGYAGTKVLITNVATYANVDGVTHSAGIVSRGSASVSFCTNYGHVTGHNCAGGITGFRTSDVNYCANYGAISGGVAGGITARITGDRTYRNLENYGTVSGASYGGGIIGRTNGGKPTVQNSSNYGTVTGAVSNGIYTVEKGKTAEVTLINCKDQALVGYSEAMIELVYNTGIPFASYEVSPNEGAYTILTADELVQLSKAVKAGNSFAGVTLYLGADLDLRGMEMEAIGDNTTAFKGIFDGQGHSISNLSIHDGALFGVTDSALLRNVKLDGTCYLTQDTSGGTAAGILAKSIRMTYVINVSSAAAVIGSVAGGIVGSGEITLLNATNKGIVYGSKIGGGIAAESVDSMLSCVNYGTVGGETAGGIVGLSNAADAKLVACFNHGFIMSSGYAGGVIGVVRQDCAVTNCANYGAVGTDPSKDAVCSATYNLETGADATVSGVCADLTVIGYSATLAKDGSEELSALIKSGIAKNIEDYDPSIEASTVRYVLIDSAEDMVRFSSMINNDIDGGDGTTFCLTADVDMSSVTDFTPIGQRPIQVSSARFFAGTFDGMGHRISGLNCRGGGLFDILKNAQVRNLILEVSGVSDVASESIGALANRAENDCFIQNVFLTVNMETPAKNVGAMIGYAKDIVISNCTVDGNLNAHTEYVGGFVGYAEGTDTGMGFYNCRSLVNVIADEKVSIAGGFTGSDAGQGIYSNCFNFGNVSAALASGAILGSKVANSGSYYVGCYNYGKVIANGAQTDALVGEDRFHNFLPLKKSAFGSGIDDYHLSRMLDVKYQTRDNGDGTFDLRLVASIDSLNYAKAGIYFNYGNEDADYYITLHAEPKTVYTSILGGDTEYQPCQEFADTSKYFVVHTVEKIPNACLKDFQSSEDSTFARAYVCTQNGSYIGFRPVEEIFVPEKLTPTIETSIGVINRFDIPNVYEIGNTGVTVNLQYHAWPSVTVDENGVLYAFASARLEHVDPFGHTVMYKSYDGGKTWSAPQVINDTPMDDRDVGVTYMGNGKMLMTYFRIETRSLLKPEQSVTTSDGKVLKGNGTYVSWQKHKNIEQKHIDALIQYWSTLPASEQTAKSWCRISDDYGATWSDPITTPCSTPHGPILLRNGTLLYVGRTSVAGVGGDGIYAFTSTDGGYHWNFLSKVHEKTEFTFCEPHVVELSNGRLLVAIRVQSGSATIEDTYRIYTSFSDDGGETWSPVRMVKDKNGKELYGTPPQLIQLDNGAVVMTCASRKSTDRGEYAIISYDGGMTWDEEINLCRWVGGTSDIGYPCTTHLGNGELVTVYYQSYQNDSYCSFLYTKWSLK